MNKLPLTLTASLLAALFSVPVVAQNTAPAPAKRPNIVVILADDMGNGDFSRFNGGLASPRTPWRSLTR